MSKLKHIAQKHLPEFVREDYPAFTEFVKAYYDWLEQNHIKKIDAIVDIDRTADQFVQYFKDSLDHDGFTFERINQRLYLKNIKDLYLTKGSENSFKFLFRAMFGKEAQISYPWEQTLKVSDGKWQQDTTLLVKITTGDGNALRGRLVNLTGPDDITYKLFISNVISRGNSVYELFIDRFFGGKISWDYDIRLPDNSVIGTTLKSTTSVKIQVAGQGFQIGQIFNVTNGPGSGSIIKVKNVGPNGEVKSVELISFGLGYDTNFTKSFVPEVSVQGQQQSVLNINLNTPGPDYSYSYPSTENIRRPEESGLIVSHDYTNPTSYPTAYFKDPTYVGDIKAQFSTETFDGDLSNACVILFELGAKCIYPGYYNASDGILDDAMYIQDSYFYQLYSYVTEIDETLESYSKVLKKSLHPAGAALFANYTVINELNLGPTIEASMDVLLREAIIQDIVTASESIIRTISKALADTFNVSEHAVFSATKKLTDSFAATELISNRPTKKATDQITATELISLYTIFNRAYSDSATSGDLINKNITKSLVDSTVGSTEDIQQFIATKVLSTSTTTGDTSKAFSVSKKLADSASVVDYIYAALNAARTYYSTAYTSDSNIDFVHTKNISETLSVIDSISMSRSGEYLEYLALNDAIITSLTKNLTDSVTTVDVINFLITYVRNLTDSATTTELVSKNVSKATTIAAATANYGEIKLEPLYTELGSFYWEAGYLEREYGFTT